MSIKIIQPHFLHLYAIFIAFQAKYGVLCAFL